MAATFAASACAQMRITEVMYTGTNGEFVEFTNVGNTPIDLAGWSFDDNSRIAGSVALAGYGTVQPGESVLLTDAGEAAFRSAWSLCAGVRIVGGNTQNLGRADEVNLYDAGGALVDRLTYDDQTIPGSPRTQNKSAWPSAAALGQNQIAGWTLSSVGDAEGSVASVGNDIASPGRSTRASVVFDPCPMPPATPTVTIDANATSPRLALAAGTQGAASGVLGDPTDPAATVGIGFVLALPGGNAGTLSVSATSSNTAVVDASGLLLSGSGTSRLLKIVPRGVGYATVRVTATDPATQNSGTYTIAYAASAAAPAAAQEARFLTGASDASAATAVDAERMLVADDETNTLRLYPRAQSGLPIAGFDFSASLQLTDTANPEVDLEAVTRIGSRLFWTGSHSLSKNARLRPNRHRVFATDVSGSGDATSLTYVGRYDWLLEDLVAWDHANGHGLGADALGLAASSTVGVDPKSAAGFNIEGLAMAPDGISAYVAFRAPLLPLTARQNALIVPVLQFDALVTGAAPNSKPQGSAAFGAPIQLDLGGRGVRSIERNAAGQYLLLAGPPGDATGTAPADFRVYRWNGQPGSAAFDIGVNLTAMDIAGGSFESIVEMPADLDAAGSLVQTLLDNGDSVFYADGIIAKDLAEPRFRKASSIRFALPSDVIFRHGFEATAGH